MCRSLYISLLVVSLVCFSCSKEDRKNTYADQEAAIDRYISTLSTDYTVTYNGGIARVTIVEGSASAPAVQAGDSVYFHYSGYVFNSGRGSLFATNDKKVAEEWGFITDGKPFGIKFASSPLVQGLQKGLEGAKEGERCYIIFSARYGYGNQTMSDLPKLTPLFFDIETDKIVRN